MQAIKYGITLLPILNSKKANRKITILGSIPFSKYDSKEILPINLVLLLNKSRHAQQANRTKQAMEE